LNVGKTTLCLRTDAYQADDILEPNLSPIFSSYMIMGARSKDDRGVILPEIDLDHSESKALAHVRSELANQMKDWLKSHPPKSTFA